MVVVLRRLLHRLGDDADGLHVSVEALGEAGHLARRQAVAGARDALLEARVARGLRGGMRGGREGEVRREREVNARSGTAQSESTPRARTAGPTGEQGGKGPAKKGRGPRTPLSRSLKAIDEGKGRRKARVKDNR